jgi:hypothetical protein
MIFKGDVFYESTTSTTSNMFNLLSDSELVFDGNVSGTFSGKAISSLVLLIMCCWIMMLLHQQVLHP